LQGWSSMPAFWFRSSWPSQVQ